MSQRHGRAALRLSREFMTSPAIAAIKVHLTLLLFDVRTHRQAITLDGKVSNYPVR